MGRTYSPKNKKAKGRKGSDFDVNFSGAEVLGRVMRAVGYHSKDIEARNKLCGMDRPDTRFEMTEEETKDAAKKIRDLTEQQRFLLYREVQGAHLIAMSQEEFNKWILEWADFLWTCGGYQVD